MLWAERAEAAQRSLNDHFWNPEIDMYNIETPCLNGACNTIFHYWWMAHAVDVLVDGWLRTGEARYAETLAALHDGIRKRNGGAYPNELYDDMEWMAIAWLRAYQATGVQAYKETALILWEDIKTGWNDQMGGGIAWQKSQLDYKNTPANAPAVILAARLYDSFGQEADLDWARRIYNWQTAHLVDPESGFVWDGINRNGDGVVDKDWKFTYCQGVYIGAAVELNRVTGDPQYLRDAYKTAAAAEEELVDPATGMLPDEEDGDGGLFKGIFVRYLAELALAGDTDDRAIQLLHLNAVMLWERGRNAQGLIGTDWSFPPKGTVSLSSQLSGVKLLERMAVLEKQGKIPLEV